MTVEGKREPAPMRSLLSHADFRISRRPDPIPVKLRRAWRVATILLTLASSRANRSGREKLLLLNYALRNPEVQDAVVDVLSGVLSPFFLELRVDPATGRALDYAVGLGLVRRLGGSRFELTKPGVDLAKALNSEESVFGPEKRFLERTRRTATETKVREILRWR